MEAPVDPILRSVRTADVEVFYRQQVDPESQAMAAFLPPNPSDRAAFLERWAAILCNPGITARKLHRQVDKHVARIHADIVKKAIK